MYLLRPILLLAVVLAVVAAGGLLFLDHFVFTIHHDVKYEENGLQLTTRSHPGAADSRVVRLIAAAPRVRNPGLDTPVRVNEPIPASHLLRVWVDGERFHPRELTAETLERLGGKLSSDTGLVSWQLATPDGLLYVRIYNGSVVRIAFRYHGAAIVDPPHVQNVEFSWDGQSPRSLPISWDEMIEYFGLPSEQRRRRSLR